jgi:hypothetical protein
MMPVVKNVQVVDLVPSQMVDVLAVKILFALPVAVLDSSLLLVALAREMHNALHVLLAVHLVQVARIVTLVVLDFSFQDPHALVAVF